MIGKPQIPTGEVEVTLTPFMKNQLMSGNKVAYMTQEPPKRDQHLRFSEHLKNSSFTKAFATSICRELAALRIDAKNETIHRLVELNKVQQWMKLSNKSAVMVIQNEGFLHLDDFWQNMWDRNGTFECAQVYFDVPVTPLL